jgi:hypothetical protein
VAQFPIPEWGWGTRRSLKAAASRPRRYVD